MTLKSKKLVKILFFIIAIIIIIIIIPILILMFKYYIPYLIDCYSEDAQYKKIFKEVCEYVEENQEVYESFSKYQISLYNNGNTDMEIEREGEHQEWRDIVFDPISHARVHNNDKGVCVFYERLGAKYDIVICYQNDIYLDGYEDDTLVYVTDNISVGLSSVRFGVV